MTSMQENSQTAGQIAITRVLSVDRSQKVGAVIRELSSPSQLESLNYVYIVSKTNKLVGVVSIKELMQADKDVSVGAIMQDKVVSVRSTTKVERAAYLALKHNIKAIPVVDKDGLFLGVLGSDDILRTLYHETRRDMLRLSGIVSSQTHMLSVGETTMWHSLKARIPWIAIGLVGGAMIAQLMSAYETTLVSDVIYVPFIPLVVYIANAVGVQTQMLYIRDKSQDPGLPYWAFLKRQLWEGVGIGLLAVIMLTALTMILWSSAWIGLVVGTAMFLSILTSIVQGVSIPRLLIKLKQDPSVGSGPFATILQDFTSVAIFIWAIVWIG